MCMYIYFVNPSECEPCPKAGFGRYYHPGPTNIRKAISFAVGAQGPLHGSPASKPASGSCLQTS